MYNSTLNMSDLQHDESGMSFLEHLEAFRWVLVRSAIAVVLAAAGAFVLYRHVFDGIILAPMSPSFFTNRVLCAIGTYLGSNSLCINSTPLNIININMAGQFNTHLQVSFLAGVIVAFPFIVAQIWSFIKPALYETERKGTRGAVAYITFLFVLGVLFGYFIISPLTIHFLGNYSISESVKNQISLSSYISSITSVTFATGLLFELPVLVFFLTKAGIITPDFLRKYRRHAFVVILVVAAVITPPDVLSLILVAFPLWLLFELSISVSAKNIRRREKASNS